MTAFLNVKPKYAEVLYIYISHIGQIILWMINITDFLRGCLNYFSDLQIQSYTSLLGFLVMFRQYLTTTVFIFFFELLKIIASLNLEILNQRTKQLHANKS